MKVPLAFLLIMFVLTSCINSPPEPTQSQPSLAPAPTQSPQANLPNPASVYCEQQGYRSEIRTAADGSQTGVCLFPDGSECDEWAYFRGECAPPQAASPTEELIDGWKVYRDDTLGFHFQYPADATLDLESNKDTVIVNGPVVDGNVWPVFMIGYAQDRDDYRVPAGTDLRQWLLDHNLYVDQPQPDVTVAATTAIHTRFPGSAQSFANDSYYFVHNEQMYVITILHTGNREDWELYNRFLTSFQFGEGGAGNEYQGWWTYFHDQYGFSIMLPEDWVVEEITTFDPLVSGNTLTLRPREIAPGMVAGKESIRMKFRRLGEDRLLWPTGVGAAECVPQGTLEIAGRPARRVQLVCPSAEVTSIWYRNAEEGQPNFTLGDLEFSFIFSASPVHCEPGYSLGGKVQHLGEMIIASLRVP